MKVEIVQERGPNGKTYIKLTALSEAGKAKLVEMCRRLGYTERNPGAPLQLELKESAPEKKRFDRLVESAEREALRIIALTGNIRRTVRAEHTRRSCRMFPRS